MQNTPQTVIGTKSRAFVETDLKANGLDTLPPFLSDEELLTRAAANIRDNLPLQTKLYRDMPLDAFLDMVACGENVLTGVCCQEDKFEAALFNLKVQFKDGEPEAWFDGIYKNAFIQSWTTNPASEGMWKAYSNVGRTRTVRIETTVGDLFRSFCDFQDPLYPYTYFIGPVAYLEESELLEKMREAMGDIHNIANNNWLFMKRDVYSYEQEVRLFYLEYPDKRKWRDYYKVSVDDETHVARYSIAKPDPESLSGKDITWFVHSVELDPWTPEYRVNSLKAILEPYGIKNVEKSDYLSKTIPPIQIPLTRSEFNQ